MKLVKLKKETGHLLKYSHLFGKNAEKFYLEKIPSKNKKMIKCKKKVSFFNKTINTEEIFSQKKMV